MILGNTGKGKEMKRKGKEANTVCITMQVTAVGNRSLFLLENSGKCCTTCTSELCHSEGNGAGVVIHQHLSITG